MYILYFHHSYFYTFKQSGGTTWELVLGVIVNTKCVSRKYRITINYGHLLCPDGVVSSEVVVEGHSHSSVSTSSRVSTDERGTDLQVLCDGTDCESLPVSSYREFRLPVSSYRNRIEMSRE